MRKTTVPWISWMDVRRSGTLGKPFWTIAWLFDKVGWLLEQTPFCIFFCSFWLDRYLPRAKTVIQSYRNKQLTEQECGRTLRGIDRRIYFYWLATVFPIMFVLLNGSVVAVLRAHIHSQPLLYLISVVTILLLHETACPSSLRHYKASVNRGDEETAGMNERASPDTQRYFRRKILGVTKKTGG